MAKIVNRRDLNFVLYEVFDVAALCERPRFAEHDRDVFDAMLESAHRIALERFANHAAELDHEEPTFDGERVHILPAVKDALDAFTQAGFLAAAFDEDDGGMQLPYTVTQALMSLFYAANTSTTAYPMLTAGAANLLAHFASDEQKQRYMAPMLTGRFFGTMCLSETQAGSSLSDIRTKAEPIGEGRYKITGSKMWISGGEHDLSENIIHLVLAKIPGGPPGVKGISLFIVPKRRVNDDGSLGELNDVQLAGLNHKMGYRGTINTVLNFGDQGQCEGYLVGEPHKGLRYMFHMMNEARVAVGLGAVMLGYAGFLHSLDYAKERPQGRHPDNKDAAQAPIAIIEHADVRRMLLLQKVFVEGGLALAIYCARLIDQQNSAVNEDERQRAELLLEILTPIAKAWPSEFCLQANKHAIQVLGGYGYTRDYPVERYYRDNRLNPIHEGTNGIQALDLLGRKVTMRQGAAFRALLAEIQTTITATRDVPSLSDFAQALQGAVDTVTQTTLALSGAAMEGRIRLFLANANEYLEMLGHTVIAWMWLKQAHVAARTLDNSPSTDDVTFYEGKLHACRFFYRWELPKIERQAKLLTSLDDTTLTMRPEWF